MRPKWSIEVQLVPSETTIPEQETWILFMPYLMKAVSAACTLMSIWAVRTWTLPSAVQEIWRGRASITTSPLTECRIVIPSLFMQDTEGRQAQTINLHVKLSVLTSIVDGIVDDISAERNEGAASLRVRVEL